MPTEYLSSQHLSWWHLPISGMFQLLLTWFWPNIKGRFLGQSSTDANWYSDICPGNLCPGNNCPFQKYLPCYWPGFDQNFWTQFLGSLIFEDHIFFWPNFFRPKYIWTKKLVGPNIFLDQFLLYLNCFETDFFWTKNFCNQNFFSF